jgi:V/A-type H+-transporting ATPase subunit A
MLQVFLHWHDRAAAAVAAGVPLRAVLDTGTGTRLVRLARVPAEDMDAAAAGLRTELEGALERLEAE